VKSPVPDRDAAKVVGNSLRDLGYESDTISELIGDDVAEREEVVVAERRLSESPLETVIRLLYLELAVSERKIDSGLAEALLATKLVSRKGDDLVPHARIVPVDENAARL